MRRIAGKTTASTLWNMREEYRGCGYEGGVSCVGNAYKKRHSIGYEGSGNIAYTLNHYGKDYYFNGRDAIAIGQLYRHCARNKGVSRGLIPGMTFGGINGTYSTGTSFGTLFGNFRNPHVTMPWSVNTFGGTLGAYQLGTLRWNDFGFNNPLSFYPF